jgi:hypothetical protein
MLLLLLLLRCSLGLQRSCIESHAYTHNAAVDLRLQVAAATGDTVDTAVLTVTIALVTLLLCMVAHLWMLPRPLLPITTMSTPLALANSTMLSPTPANIVPNIVPPIGPNIQLVGQQSKKRQGLDTIRTRVVTAGWQQQEQHELPAQLIAARTSCSLPARASCKCFLQELPGKQNAMHHAPQTRACAAAH